MVLDKHGEKRSHTFMRAMMKSAAKLSYQEAQAAIDGRAGREGAPLLDRALEAAVGRLQGRRQGARYRQPLDLDLPERKIVLDGEGRIANVVVPPRLEAHIGSSRSS